MAVRGEGRPLHACVNSTNYFYIIVFYTVNSLLQQHTQKHVTYGKWVEIIIREFWNFIREKSGNFVFLKCWEPCYNVGLCVYNPREKIVFTVFRRVFHSILKLKLCRHPCRRRDQIIPTCRYGKNMPTTALLITQIFGSSLQERPIIWAHT